MASETCYYWPTILCRNYHSNILEKSSGSPAEHITLNFDNELLEKIRNYLGYEGEYIEQKTGISLSNIKTIESGFHPVPKSLILFYAKSLKVKPSYLQAILSSDKKPASSRISNKLINNYLRLILKLRKYEAKK